jgi:predicted acylesterase/phospholipase RssA
MPPQPKPFRVQLALQGGGAKIAALLAALEAANELQREGELEVTRIAGTSAGAIAGCLYAAGENLIPLGRVKLSSVKPKDVERVFPKPWPLKVFSLKPFKRPGLLMKLILGNPLWKTKFIEKLLEEVLRESGETFDTVEDLSRPRGIVVKIVATDLTNSRKLVHEGSSPLMNALMDSCGIPYCFRTWSKAASAVIVDGGISENLPSEELDSPQDVEKFGPVVGIGFRNPSRNNIDDALSFSAALLDAAMQNSMQRARARLGSGAVLTLDTNLETFNFVDALVNGLNPQGAYGYVKGTSKEWLKDFLQRHKKTRQVIVGDPWSTQGIPIMEKLWKIYEVQRTKMKYEHVGVTVQARCLLREGDEDYGRPDLVSYRGKLSTLNEKVYCHRILVSDAYQETTLERTSWHVTDLTNNREIEAIDLPMRSPEARASKTRELLLFLKPALQPRTGPYQFDIQNLVDGFLKPLAEKGIDEVVFDPRQADGTIGQIDLVLWVPRDFPEVRLSPKKGVGGRQMTVAELAKYAIPPNYAAYGWTDSDVRSEIPFGIDINVNKPA